MDSRTITPSQDRPSHDRKNEASSSEFEVDSPDLQDGYLQSKTKSLRLIDAARISVTVFALLCGITILGLSADAVGVYNTTNLPGDFLLPLWPADFDLRPTVALITGSSILAVANMAALVCSKVPHLRNNAPVHTPVMFAAPFVGLVAALVSIIFFYTINTSQTNDSLLSWTCRWKAVSMTQSPHFSTLCTQSWASVYLAVILVPVEAAALCVAAWQFKLEKHTSAYAHARKGSPVQA